MAGRSVEIPSSGITTPEYNAVRKSYGEINPAIIPDDFVIQAHSCGLIPTRNPSSPPLDVVLDEISRDPVDYYSLQHVVATLNVENRFDKGIDKMEKTFQCKGNVGPRLLYAEYRKNSRKKSVQQDLNPLHSVPHTRAQPLTQPPLLLLLALAFLPIF
jgi:hypothetical protein